MVLLTLVCRFSTTVADMYALHVYPVVSAVLSWLSSFTTYGIQEIILAMIVIYACIVALRGIRQRRGLKVTLIPIVRILTWTYISFYTAWCINYSRSAIYVRTSERMQPYNEAIFRQFLNDFINNANRSYTINQSYDKQQIINEIKQQYSIVPSVYGLATPHSWQQPKQSVFNSLYSSVSVLGFMAPLVSESYINSDLPDSDYPFTYAHELSHLLGVSNEAEANWWAFHICTSSQHPAVRYSAYKAILPYVLNNAAVSLSQEEYSSIVALVRKEVINDIRASHTHWQSLQSPMLRKLHTLTYDIFLKGNNVSKGIENYSQVVALLINLESPS